MGSLYYFNYQINATCQALYEILSIGDNRGQETGKKLWESIVEGVKLVLVFYDRTTTEELLPLVKDFVSRKDIFAFESMLNSATANKKELEDMDKIELARYLPAVLKVVALKINNFQDWKEGDDDLKKAMNLFKEKYDLSLKFINKHKKSQTDEVKDSAPGLKETFKKYVLVKNKKDTPSRNRRYQCPYGCMTVFFKKNGLFRHQIETNRACKYKNADKLPVKPLPQSEHALLDMIWNTLGKVSEDSVFPIYRDERMVISIAAVEAIKVDNEPLYDSAMDALMMGIESPSTSESSFSDEESDDSY